MTVSWTTHRFSGGALALDVTNTVVLRNDSARSFDRFSDISEIPRFAEVASVQRAGELEGRRLDASGAEDVAPRIIRLREATDALFRDAARTRRIGSGKLGDFLGLCSNALARHRVDIDLALNLPRSHAPVAFEAAVAISALSLLQPQKIGRIRICANCCWLFLDESRNRSRIWCDMAVCGNRQKARRHYRRHSEREAQDA
jgi:predicted RNA-binding Zn ribbon-like protein